MSRRPPPPGGGWYNNDSNTGPRGPQLKHHAVWATQHTHGTTRAMQAQKHCYHHAFPACAGTWEPVHPILACLGVKCEMWYGFGAGLELWALKRRSKAASFRAKNPVTNHAEGLKSFIIIMQTHRTESHIRGYMITHLYHQLKGPTAALRQSC